MKNEKPIDHGILTAHSALIKAANSAISDRPECRLTIPIIFCTHRLNIEHLGLPAGLRHPALALFYDIGNLANAAGRIEWARQQCIKSNIEWPLWYQLAQMDIEFGLVKNEVYC